MKARRLVEAQAAAQSRQAQQLLSVTSTCWEGCSEMGSGASCWEPALLFDRSNSSAL